MSPPSKNLMDIKRIKRFDQFFVKHKVIRKLMGYVERLAEEGPINILEIGAGSGNLTKELIPYSKQILAVELDRDLATYLRERFADDPVVVVVEEDILNYTFPPGLDLVIGNIPYYISSDLIKKLIKERNKFKTAILMLQKEFVDKLLSQPGDKGYTYISVLADNYFDMERLFNISRHEYIPVPKVDSSVLRLTPKSNPQFSPEELSIIQKLFSHRKKRLRRILKDLFGVDDDRLTLLGELADKRIHQVSKNDLKKVVGILRG